MGPILMSSMVQVRTFVVKVSHQFSWSFLCDFLHPSLAKDMVKGEQVDDDKVDTLTRESSPMVPERPFISSAIGHRTHLIAGASQSPTTNRISPGCELSQRPRYADRGLTQASNVLLESRLSWMEP
ncbi:hypothetical protein MKZ38_010314 [Zalerion maritima]|uniref:Uncharacterized protein n=1 Tax=Zalerion maritima TaxID=339359 RepID=A0AAD5RU37_9PEZI|nr:hypothetical protein MKZ38_010314 [Zalerion maritima]